MLKECKANTNIGVGLGIVAQIAGRAMSSPADASGGLLGPLLLVAGAVLFIWGCMQYAKGKGYSGWLGLLGLLSIIGLLVLVLLKDKHKEIRA